MENEEFIREFLEESEENLDQLDQDFVSLEQDPGDLERLDSIYRAIHTIKGTSGFFGFSKLGAVAHAAENLLSRLRDGEITLNEGLTSALLESVDAIRDILANIGSDGEEGDGNYRELNQQLEELCSSAPIAETQSVVANPAQVEPVTPDDEKQDSDEPATVEDQPSISDHDTEVTEHTDPDYSEASQSTATEPRADTTPDNEASDAERHESDLVNQQTGDHKTTITTSVSVPEPASKTTDSPSDSPKTGNGPDTGKSQGIGSEGSIRVDVGLLNQLMDLVGELVLARNQLLQTESNEHDRRLTNVTQQVNRITTELQERVMQTRMQPIGNIWGKFPRLVRDLAVMCGKDVDLLMDGAETEVDKSLLEAIKDPLTHLIRNAIDHGIESGADRISCGKNKRGQLHLRAWHQGGKVNIEISDNGQGIDPAKIRAKAIAKNLITAQDAKTMGDQQLVQIIFWPGFSTAPQVTGISGRGVGMDVVKTNIESIGGTIDVQSRVGIGTAIKVKIPLTLAIVPALIISSCEQLFAIPQSHLVEMLRLDLKNESDRIEKIRDTPVYRLRGELLPIVYLSKLLGTEATVSESTCDHVNIVVLQADNCRFGLVVDHVERTEEIVVKALHPTLGVIPHLAGATVMGDGRVAIILDVLGITSDIGLTVEELKQASELIEQPGVEQRANHMLIFRLASGRELAMPLSEIDRLEDIPQGSIEQTEQMQAVQYRGQIMPLLPLSQLLGETPQPIGTNDNVIASEVKAVKAIVINVEGSHTAIAVREIVDVAEQQGPMRLTNKPGSLIRGAAVIEGKVTDVLDLQSVLHSSGFDQHAQMKAAT
ncbi:MAG: histidine kinase [Planctomycetaceae bacterium]|nr:histidine kinase [Planctomycetaceae bacterium]